MKRYVVALLMFAMLAVSCSTNASPASDPTVSSSQRPPAPKLVAHVGDTLDLMRVGDQKIAVTLMRVIAPATVPAGWGDASKTYIATQLKIANTGTSTIVGNSKSDVSVVGSDNQTYRADLATVTECKDFAYGWFLLAAGSSTTGCVVFGLPHGVAPTKIKYIPSSGISRDVGEWLNSSNDNGRPSGAAPKGSDGPKLLDDGHTANHFVPLQNWDAPGFIGLAMANYTTVLGHQSSAWWQHEPRPLARQTCRRAPATPGHLLSVVNPAT